MKKMLVTDESKAFWSAVSALTVLVGSIVIAWLSPRMSRELFCTRDEACIREWVSVLGGYFAFAAAYFTIRRMTKDAESALKYQKQNIKISMRRDFAVAHLAQRKLFSAETLVMNLEEHYADMAGKVFEWDHVRCARVVSAARALREGYGAELEELLEVMPPVSPNLSIQLRRLDTLIAVFDSARELDLAIRIRRSDDHDTRRDLFWRCELTLRGTSKLSRKCWEAHFRAVGEFLEEWAQPSQLPKAS